MVKCFLEGRGRKKNIIIILLNTVLCEGNQPNNIIWQLNNELNSMRILIGCYVRSIGGQMHK